MIVHMTVTCVLCSLALTFNIETLQKSMQKCAMFCFGKYTTGWDARLGHLVWTQGGNQTAPWLQTCKLTAHSLSSLLCSECAEVQEEPRTASLASHYRPSFVKWRRALCDISQALLFLLRCPSLGPRWASSKLQSRAQRCHFFSIKGPQSSHNQQGRC